MNRYQNIEAGDLILVEGTRWWDRAIEWWTLCPFAHVAIADGQGRLIEALPAGVQVNPVDRWGDLGWVYRCSILTQQQRYKIATCALGMNGNPYGWGEVLRSVRIATPWTPVNSKHLDCSGLVAWAYEQAGVKLTWAPNPTPADISYSPLLEGNRPWRLI